MALKGTPTVLTVLERQVLAASATGLTSAEVAEHLGVEVDAVRRALTSSIVALGARSKLEAVIIALRHGLIDVS